jgi:hypothetical protein
LKSSLRKFYGHHHDLVDVMEYLCHKWPRICSTCRKHFPILSSFMTYHSCNNVAPVTNLCLGRATTRSHSSQWSTKKVAVET